MTTSTGTLPSIISYVISFINGYLVPFVFAIAFAMFLFGIFRFYFLKGADAKSREEGRGFIIGGIVAFAVMVSIWGLVNLVQGSIPFTSLNQPPLPTFNATSGSNVAPSSSNVAPSSSNCANDDYACAAAQQAQSKTAPSSSNCAPDDYACAAAQAQQSQSNVAPSSPNTDDSVNGLY